MIDSLHAHIFFTTFILVILVRFSDHGYYFYCEYYTCNLSCLHNVITKSTKYIYVVGRFIPPSFYVLGRSGFFYFETDMP